MNKILLFLIGLSIAAMIFGSTSCNVTKRAERKLDKSKRLDYNVFAKECARAYDPTDSVHERIIHVAGKTIRDTIISTELEIINDTVYKTRVKTITVSKTDTIKLDKYEREANKAALDSTEVHYKGLMSEAGKEAEKLKEKVAKQSVTISYLWWAVIVLGVYTLGRWVLRYFTKIKLP